MKRLVYFFPVLLLCSCLITDAQEVLDNINNNFSGVETIHVKGVFCDVKVEAGSNESVQLTGVIRGTRRVNNIKIRAEQNGSTLEVWVQHSGSLRGNFKGFLDFIVPTGITLRVENISGNVKVSSVGRGELWLESVSGNVEASEIPCNLTGKSVSGNILASVIEGNLEAHSVSGNLEIANVKGTFSGRSVSGNIDLKMIEDEVNAETTSGDCTLNNMLSSARVKSTSGNVRVSQIKGDLKAKTLSGDVLINEGVGTFDVETLSGNQRGNRIMLTGDSRFHSASGDINMGFLNPEGAISYRLSSSSGSLRAAGTSGEKQLVIDGGPIVVTGTSTSGDISLP